MTGISEILVLILLICGILIVPRMFKPAPAATSKPKKMPSPFGSMKMRAGIVASILYPAILGLILKPWQGNPTLYISLGILPVLLAWAVIWVFAAKKK